MSVSSVGRAVSALRQRMLEDMAMRGCDRLPSASIFALCAISPPSWDQTPTRSSGFQGCQSRHFLRLSRDPARQNYDFALEFDDFAQRCWLQNRDAAISGFDQAACGQSLHDRADGIARQIGRASKFDLGDRRLGRLAIAGAGETASAQPQQSSRASPLAVADEQIGGDALRGVAIYDGGLQETAPPLRPLRQHAFDMGLRNPGDPGRELGVRRDAPGLSGDDGDVAEPEDRICEVHDWGIGGTENGLEREHAARQPDQFSRLFAAGLDWFSGFVMKPSSRRQDRTAKAGRRAA